MKYQDIETLPKVSQVKLDLIAAKMLIDTQDKWCRHATSKSYPDGRTERCAFGALVAAINDRDRYLAAIEALMRAIPFSNTVAVSVERFNDTHTHAELMALWDRAIARA